MKLTRRQFSQGAMALAGARGTPAIPLPAELGADDAYEILLSRYIRAEEDALYSAGTSIAHEIGGAASWQGRQIESFLSDLDMRVDVSASAQQLINEFRTRVKKTIEAQPLPKNTSAEPLTTSESDTTLPETDAEHDLGVRHDIGANHEMGADPEVTIDLAELTTS